MPIPVASNASVETVKVQDSEPTGLSGFALIFYVMALLYKNTESHLNDLTDELSKKLEKEEALRDANIKYQAILDGAVDAKESELPYRTDLDVNGDGNDDLIIDLGNNQYLVIALDSTGNVIKEGENQFLIVQTMNGLEGFDQFIPDSVSTSGTSSFTIISTDPTNFFNGTEEFLTESNAKVWFEDGQINICRGSAAIVIDMKAGTDGVVIDTAQNGYELDQAHVDNHLINADGSEIPEYDKNQPSEYDETEGEGWSQQQYILNEIQSDPDYLAFCTANGIDSHDKSALKLFINAPIAEGGLGLEFNDNPFTDTSWLGAVIENNKNQIDSLSSMDQLDTLELQKTIDMLNFIVNALTNMIKTYFDGLLSVARDF